MVAFWVLGVVLVIVGSLGNNYGNNLVSLGHAIKKKTDEKGKLTNICKEKEMDDKIESAPVEKPEAPQTEAEKAEERSHARWRTFGVIVIVVANLATFASFGFAAQSLLAALESVQFLSNVAFAKLVHKEQISRRTVIATFIIIAGNVLVVLFADKKAVILNSADLIHLYRTNNVYHAYLVVAFVLFVSLHFLYLHYHKARTVHNRKLWKHSFIEPFAYSVSAAIIGTQAVLNSKCMSMLIQSSARTDRNEFERPVIWVILVTWIMFVAYWLRRLDLGLMLFPPQFIIPVLQVFFVFFAILCGGIYFEEFQTFTMVQYIGFCVGVVLILVGVYLLAPVDNDVVPLGPDGEHGGGTPAEVDGVPGSGQNSNHKYSADNNNVIVGDATDLDNLTPNNYSDAHSPGKQQFTHSIELVSQQPHHTSATDMSHSQTLSNSPVAVDANLPPEDGALRFDVMDPAELELKKKRVIVKRPTNPADVADVV